MTEPPEEDLGMIFFKRLPTKAQEESSNPMGLYRMKAAVVDGGLGLSILLELYDERFCSIRTRRANRDEPVG